MRCIVHTIWGHVLILHALSCILTGVETEKNESNHLVSDQTSQTQTLVKEPQKDQQSAGDANTAPGHIDAMTITEPPTGRQTIRNLRAFAKLYGYVRFFHPSDEASSIDWRTFAVYAAEQVKSAKSSGLLKETLESLFLPIAPTIQIYSENERPTDLTKSLPKNTDGLKAVAWQHLGVKLYGWTGYKSLRLNREYELPPRIRGSSKLNPTVNIPPGGYGRQHLGMGTGLTS